MDWEQIKSDFDWDGSWRDIYVLGASIADWQMMLDMVRERFPRRSFLAWTREEGQSIEPPERAEDLFAPEGASAYLCLYVEGVELNCLFAIPDEIEFHLDPRQVTGMREVNGLGEFMRSLGRRLGKGVVLTLENSSPAWNGSLKEHAVILRYLPDRDEVVWVPPICVPRDG